MTYITTFPTQSCSPSVSFFSPSSPILTREETQQQLARLQGKIDFLEGAIKSIDFFPLNYFTSIQKTIQGLKDTLASLEQKKEKLEEEVLTQAPNERSRLGQPQVFASNLIHSSFLLDEHEHKLVEVQGQINTVRSMINGIDANAGQGQLSLAWRLNGISRRLNNIKETKETLKSAKEQPVHALSITSQEAELQAQPERVLPPESGRQGAEQNITVTLAFNLFGHPVKVGTIQLDQFVFSKQLIYADYRSISSFA